MEFSVGDWVKFERKGHQWDGMHFKVKHVHKSFVAGYQIILYDLEYGNRTVSASEDEVSNTLEIDDFGLFGDLMKDVPRNERKYLVDEVSCSHKNKRESFMPTSGKFWHCPDCKKWWT